METEAPTTAVDYAGARVLGNGAEACVINNLRGLFLDAQFLEHGRSSDMHKSILVYVLAILRKGYKGLLPYWILKILPGGLHSHGQHRRVKSRRSECY